MRRPGARLLDYSSLRWLVNNVLPALGTSIWPSARVNSCVHLRIVAIEVRIELACSCMTLWRPPSFTTIAAATSGDASTDPPSRARLLPGGVVQQWWSSAWSARREPRCARPAPDPMRCARATQRRASPVGGAARAETHPLLPLSLLTVRSDTFSTISRLLAINSRPDNLLRAPQCTAHVPDTKTPGVKF